MSNQNQQPQQEPADRQEIVDPSTGEPHEAQPAGGATGLDTAALEKLINDAEHLPAGDSSTDDFTADEQISPAAATDGRDDPAAPDAWDDHAIDLATRRLDELDAAETQDLASIDKELEDIPVATGEPPRRRSDEQPAQHTASSAAPSEQTSAGKEDAAMRAKAKKVQARRQAAEASSVARPALGSGAGGSSGKLPSGFSAGSARPGLDSRVAAATAKPGPPPWLGTQWSKIAPEHQADAWISLRRFVDELIDTWDLPAQVIPGCWFLHPGMVEELYAAQNMAFKAWEEGAPSMSPLMMWHQNLQLMIQRLRTMVSEHGGGCAKGEHKPVETTARDYDEDTWRKVVSGRRETKTVQKPGEAEDPYLVRARVIGPSEATLAESDDEVGISARKPVGEPEAIIYPEQMTGAADAVLRFEAYSVPAAQQVIWEVAEFDPDLGEITSDWTIYQEPTKPADQAPAPEKAAPPARAAGRPKLGGRGSAAVNNSPAEATGTPLPPRRQAQAPDGSEKPES